MDLFFSQLPFESSILECQNYIKPFMTISLTQATFIILPMLLLIDENQEELWEKTSIGILPKNQDVMSMQWTGLNKNPFPKREQELNCFKFDLICGSCWNQPWLFNKRLKKKKRKRKERKDSKDFKLESAKMQGSVVGTRWRAWLSWGGGGRGGCRC